VCYAFQSLVAHRAVRRVVSSEFGPAHDSRVVCTSAIHALNNIHPLKGMFLDSRSNEGV